MDNYTSCPELALLLQMKNLQIASNHAIVIIYIGCNNAAEQRHMKKQLDMNATVLSSVIRLLIAQGYVEQVKNQQRVQGHGVLTKHYLTETGRNLFNLLVK